MSFSCRETVYCGSPVLEVLVDGDSWHSRYDTHFRFGLAKAHLIITACYFIELFYLTNGTSPKSNEPIGLVRSESGTCICTKHDSFENSFGRRVNEKYLEIQSGDIRLGLGLKKAEALLSLQSEIAVFCASHTSN